MSSSAGISRRQRVLHVREVLDLQLAGALGIARF